MHLGISGLPLLSTDEKKSSVPLRILGRYTDPSSSKAVAVPAAARPQGRVGWHHCCSTVVIAASCTCGAACFHLCELPSLSQHLHKVLMDAAHLALRGPRPLGPQAPVGLQTGASWLSSQHRRAYRQTPVLRLVGAEKREKSCRPCPVGPPH